MATYSYLCIIFFMSFTFIDLFAGAGGFGLGFKMAGGQHKLSLEIDKWAYDTLVFNSSKDAKIVNANITDYNSESSIREICPLTPDVIIGGPPCQGFSTAGPSKDPNDPRNSLFKNYAKWVEVLKPKVFVMENVTGILTRKNGNGEKVIDIILATFRNLGYNVEVWKLNAAEYGVPQTRRRIFIVGNITTDNIGEPKKTHFLKVNPEDVNSNNLPLALTIKDAISDLPYIQAHEGSEIQDYTVAPSCEFQRWAREKSKYVYNHVSMKHTSRLIERFKALMNGTSKLDLPDEFKVLKRGGNGEYSEIDYNSNYRHLRLDMVSYTIPASFYSNFIHPTCPRNITSREAARIQSFPDHYFFKGKRTQISKKLLRKLNKDEDHLSQYNQIGNAVPPLLAKAIADKVGSFLHDKTNDEIIFKPEIVDIFNC